MSDYDSLESDAFDARCAEQAPEWGHCAGCDAGLYDEDRISTCSECGARLCSSCECVGLEARPIVGMPGLLRSRYCPTCAGSDIPVGVEPDELSGYEVAARTP